MSTQPPLQVRRGAAQFAALPQTPSVHTLVEPHAFPQLPQFIGSVIVSTQVPEHIACGGSHGP